MKSSIALLAVGASFAVAQSISDLPLCGQTCMNNMQKIAVSEFGCASGDVGCYCANPNFGYGIRDCANESCSSSDAAKTISFGTSYCAAALASASASGSGSALSVLSSALATATVTGTGASGASAQSTAITTIPLIATVSANDTTYATTTGFSTVYSSLSGAVVSTASSAASHISSVSSVAASHASSAASGASSAASGASAASAATASGSATATGGATMMTAAPILGAAGIAALLFI